MALEKKDLEALQLLIREEIRAAITPFRSEFQQFRDDSQSNFDALFARDEKREQENAIRDEQITRIDKRVSTLEKKVA